MKTAKCNCGTGSQIRLLTNRAGDYYLKCAYCGTQSVGCPTEYGALVSWNYRALKGRRKQPKIYRTLCTYECELCGIKCNTRGGLGNHKAKRHKPVKQSDQLTQVI